jgi:hypothetical protein
MRSMAIAWLGTPVAASSAGTAIRGTIAARSSVAVAPQSSARRKKRGAAVIPPALPAGARGVASNRGIALTFATYRGAIRPTRDGNHGLSAGRTVTLPRSVSGFAGVGKVIMRLALLQVGPI